MKLYRLSEIHEKLILEIWFCFFRYSNCHLRSVTSMDMKYCDVILQLLCERHLGSWILAYVSKVAYSSRLLY